MDEDCENTGELISKLNEHNFNLAPVYLDKLCSHRIAAIEVVAQIILTEANGQPYYNYSIGFAHRTI